MRSATHSIHIYIFLNEIFRAMALQEKLHLDRVGRQIISRGLNNLCIFDILQVPNRCFQIFSGCNAPSCSSLATGLLTANI